MHKSLESRQPRKIRCVTDGTALSFPFGWLSHSWDVSTLVQQNCRCLTECEVQPHLSGKRVWKIALTCFLSRPTYLSVAKTIHHLILSSRDFCKRLVVFPRLGYNFRFNAHLPVSAKWQNQPKIAAQKCRKEWNVKALTDFKIQLTIINQLYLYLSAT